MIHNQVFYNKLLLNALCVFLFIFLFSRSTFRFYSLYLIMCEICNKKYFKRKIWKIKILFTKNEMNKSCSWKMVLHFNKRAPFFNKRTLGLSRRVRAGRIPSNCKLFFTLLIQIKDFFSKKALFNEVSNLRTLSLFKMDLHNGSIRWSAVENLEKE